MKTTPRLPDWRVRLMDWIAAERPHGFAWGTHDCVLFATGAAMAMTGKDPIKRWRGKWSDLTSGVRIVKRNGGLEDMADRIFDRQTVAEARRGDWVLIAGDTPDHGPALAVCDGRITWGYYGGRLMMLPTAEALSSWRVGV